MEPVTESPEKKILCQNFEHLFSWLRNILLIDLQEMWFLPVISLD